MLALCYLIIYFKRMAFGFCVKTREPCVFREVQKI